MVKGKVTHEYEYNGKDYCFIVYTRKNLLKWVRIEKDKINVDNKSDSLQNKRVEFDEKDAFLIDVYDKNIYDYDGISEISDISVDNYYHTPFYSFCYREGNVRTFKKISESSMDKYFKTVLEFKTPLGILKLIDSNGKTVPLKALENKIDYIDVMIGNDENNIVKCDRIKSFLIKVDLEHLNIWEEYNFVFSNKWDFFDSDERLFTLNYVENDKVVSFGFQDPNDMAYIDRVDPIHFDMGFNNKKVYLNIIDKDIKSAYCSVAWMWDINEHFDDYEDACDLVTWNI